MRSFGLALVVSLLFMAHWAWAREPTHLTGLFDMPASAVLPKGKLELGISYCKMDDNLDLLNLRDTDYTGDYEGIKLFLAYGLSDTVSFIASGGKRRIDYNMGEVDVYSYSYSLRKSFGSVVSIEGGIRLDYGDNQKFTSVESINYYIHKVRPDVSIEVDPLYVWFVKDTKSYIAKMGVLREQNPYVKIEDMKDYTIFARITLGKFFKWFYPNIFMEVGKTQIDTKIKTNLLDMLPEGYRERVDEITGDLSRDETYYKIGGSFFLKLPFRFLLTTEAYYLKIDRDEELDFVDYNAVFEADLHYFVSKRVVVSMGGTYLHRQLNGVVPFLYNRFTQTAFDHRYGWLRLGVRVLY